MSSIHDASNPSFATMSISSVSAAITLPGKFAAFHSFQAPFQRTIQNWSHGAGTFINDKVIALTPAKPQRTGYLWNNQPVLMTDWEVVFEFKVTGATQGSAGEGMAWWFASQPELLGTVYGSTDYWLGLGLFFDTVSRVESSPVESSRHLILAVCIMSLLIFAQLHCSRSIACALMTCFARQLTCIALIDADSTTTTASAPLLQSAQCGTTALSASILGATAPLRRWVPVLSTSATL